MQQCAFCWFRLTLEFQPFGEAWNDLSRIPAGRGGRNERRSGGRQRRAIAAAAFNVRTGVERRPRGDRGAGRRRRAVGVDRGRGLEGLVTVARRDEGRARGRADDGYNRLKSQMWVTNLFAIFTRKTSQPLDATYSHSS